MYINTYISSINNAFYSEMACSLSDYLLTLPYSNTKFYICFYHSVWINGSKRLSRLYKMLPDDKNITQQACWL